MNLYVPNVALGSGYTDLALPIENGKGVRLSTPSTQSG